MKDDKKWYVVYTKPKLEKRTSEILEKKQIPVYLPEYNKLQYLYGRRKMVKTPLLPSLLFVLLNEQQVETIIDVNGVAGILYKLQKPAVIKSKEIAAMQLFLAEHNDITIEKVPLGNYTEAYTAQANSLDKLYLDMSYDSEKLFLPSLGYSLIAKSAEVFATNVA